MKNYKDITYRYLKGQKNRTLLTILGIILSVAMISAIGTIIISARGALLDEAIREEGSYHARYRKVDQSDIDKIINHVGIGESGISQNIGIGIVRETTEEERKTLDNLPPYRYIEIEGLTDESLNMLPYTIEEGRFPRNSNELVIDPTTATYFEKVVKIGDRVNLTIGDRIFIVNEESEEARSEELFEKRLEREYTVVGFLKPKYRGNMNFETKALTVLDKESPVSEVYNVYFKLPNIKNAQERIFSIAKDVGVDPDNIKDNYRVLRLSGESLNETFNSSIIGLLAFIIILVMISTIAVIYNAFNISVLERVSQFGLLRSVGATPSQIKNIVLKEAAILSAIGIPIGLLSGVLAMKIVFSIIGLMPLKNINLIDDMKITISVGVFIFSGIIGIITVFLSAIGPARRAAKVSPLEAVRNAGSFKKESFDKIKKSIFIRKVLGIEGEIAYKNLRRNRTRFYITVFSMVISICLFIIFATFSNFMFKIGVVQSEDLGDFIVYDQGELNEDIYKELRKVEDIDRVYNLRETSGIAMLSENKISKRLMEMSPYLFDSTDEDSFFVHNVVVYTIGDENFEALKALLKEGTSNINDLDTNNGALVINNVYAHNEKTDKQMLMEGYHIKPGDSVSFSSFNRDIEGQDPIYEQINIMGVLEKGILDMEYNWNGGFSIIVTEKQWAKVNEGNRDYSTMYVEMNKDADIENVRQSFKRIEKDYPGFSYVDMAEVANENRLMGIVMSIFLYGFVTIITLIGCINIINTISTNIILRTKEIAMIKAVGMTQSGIKRMVALESLYYGLYAAVFGGVIGTGLTYVLFKIVFNIREFQWTMPWTNILIACGGATLVALISGVYPLKRINDSIIVENMKNEE